MFHEIRFPGAIAFHSSGGPERKTEIVTLGSGFEERNAVWANSRRRYDVGYGIRTLDDLHGVLEFFEARMGCLYGFRFCDFADFKSCAPGAAVQPNDQNIGTGDGTTKTFQLSKTYRSGTAQWVRPIKKPVVDSVRIAFDGVEQSGNFSVDTTKGLVGFTAAPGSGAIVSAGFAFDTPVRFDSDFLALNLANFMAGDIPSILLVEVLL